jgi:hypothetical protein
MKELESLKSKKFDVSQDLLAQIRGGYGYSGSGTYTNTYDSSGTQTDMFMSDHLAD